MNLRVSGGGDWPESVNEALFVAVTKLPWTRGRDTTRIIFLVGDAPPHMDYPQDMKYPDVMRLARQQGIVVNAVQAGTARDTERVWRDIAQMGRGEYISIPQNGGEVVIIVSPFDRDIIDLQGRINRTVVPYGSPQQRKRVDQRSEQLQSAPSSVATDMAGYLNRNAGRSSGGDAITGEGDLVADVKAGRKQLSTLNDEELPDSVRRLTPAERQVHLDKQAQERMTLNAQLTDLVRKRDHYVTDQRKKAPARSDDSFDRAVEKTLRAQIR